MVRRTLLLGIILCLSGVHASRAGEGIWTPLGPYGGPVRSVAFSPGFAADRTVFAAAALDITEGHGIFRSTDGGRTWSPANRGLAFGRGHTDPHVYSLAVSPDFADDRTVFAGGASGLLRSTDGGDSWAFLASGFTYAQVALSPSFAADRTLFGTDGYLLRRSTDGGTTWKETPYCCGDGLAVSPDFAADGIVLAGRSRSADGGLTFDEMPAFGYESARFAFSPGYAADGTVLAGTSVGRVLVSRDRGLSWTSAGRPSPSAVGEVAFSPGYPADPTLLAANRQGLWRSTDDGETWVRLAGLPTEEALSLAFSPAFAADRLILAGAVSGLYRSDDGGEAWAPSSTGITGYTARRFAPSPAYADDRTLFVDTGRGLFRTSDGGDSWTRLRRGSGEMTLVAVSPGFAADRTLFAWDDLLVRSDDGGDTWAEAGQPVLSATPSVWAVSPTWGTRPTLMAAAKVSSNGPVGQVARSDDGGDTWEPATEVQRQLFVEALALSPAFAADGTALVGTEAGFIGGGWIQGARASTDGGATWPHGALGSDCMDPDDCWPTAGFAVAFSPAYADDRTAFVGTRGGRVWRNGAGVDDTDAWTPAALPAGDFVTALAVSPAFADDGKLWAGTESSGIHLSATRGRLWRSVNAGLEDRRTLGLAPSPAYADDRTLFAATGSGLWALTGDPAPEPADVALSPPVLDFGTVARRRGKNLTYTLANQGGRALTVSRLGVTGLYFSLVAPRKTPFTLKPGASTPVTVRFRPLTVGRRRGRATVASSDPDEPVAAVTLIGRGAR
jgi:photosystem II stability/assembly factor-like uncharacterized protein